MPEGGGFVRMLVKVARLQTSGSSVEDDFIVYYVVYLDGKERVLL